MFWSKPRNKRRSTKRGSSSSSNSKEIKGGEWTGTLYFTPNADSPRGYPVEVEHDNLKQSFSQVEGTQDEIRHVWIYKQNLSPLLPKFIKLWHEFAVVESSNWFWSFEKDAEGIFVQRSKTFRSVQQYYRKMKRPGTEGLDKTISWRLKDKKTVKDIFDMIYIQNYLREPYHLFSSNCQYFASVLVDDIVKGQLSKSVS